MLIAAGSNGAYLRSRIDKPLVLIRPGGFDLMQALSQAHRLSPKIGLVTHETEVPVFAEFQASFGLSIEQRAFVTAEDARMHVAELVAKNNPADVAALGALPYTQDGFGPTLEDVRKGLIGKIGENMSFRRFKRFEGGNKLVSYLHGTRIGVVVEYEGDDTAAKDVAMHVAAMKPVALSSADVPAELIEKERAVALALVGAVDGKTGVPVNFAQRPLWLVRGVDRSGSNDFRGSVYEYHRNEGLDANNYFNNARGVERSPLKYIDRAKTPTLIIHGAADPRVPFAWTNPASGAPTFTAHLRDIGHRKESEATQKLYGPGSTARGCLTAVRLIEKGVRMVQVYYAKGDPWAPRVVAERDGKRVCAVAWTTFTSPSASGIISTAHVLVAATPISGPACVRIVPSASR